MILNICGKDYLTEKTENCCFLVKFRGDIMSGAETRAKKASMATQQAEGEPVSLDSLMAKLLEIEAKQDSAIQILQQKMDDLKAELKLDIDKRIGEFQESINSTVATIQDDCLSLRQDLQAVKAVVSIEPVANVDNTVVLVNLRQSADDPVTLKDNVDQLIKALGTDVYESVNIVQVKQLPGREGKPGLVKVALDSTEAKVKVLRAKHKLKDSDKFKKVWLRTSKSHAERIAEVNFKRVLQLLPGGDKLRLSGNGKIIERTEEAGGVNWTAGDSPRGRRGVPRGGPGGRGRGGYGRGSPIGRGQPIDDL